jgi:hypothetical protein
LKTALSRRANTSTDSTELTTDGNNEKRPDICSSELAISTENIFDLNSDAIDRSALFVLITSRASVADDACGEELHAAYENSKHIIAVWVDDPKVIEQALTSAGSVGMMLQQAPTIKIPDCQFPASNTPLSAAASSTKSAHILLASVFENLAAAADITANKNRGEHVPAGPPSPSPAKRDILMRIPSLPSMRSNKVNPAGTRSIQRGHIS